MHWLNPGAVLRAVAWFRVILTWCGLMWGDFGLVWVDVGLLWGDVACCGVMWGDLLFRTKDNIEKINAHEKLEHYIEACI